MNRRNYGDSLVNQLANRSNYYPRTLRLQSWEVQLEHLKKIEERYYFDSKNNLIRYTEDDKTYDKGKIPQKYIEEAGNTLEEFLRLKDELN